MTSRRREAIADVIERLRHAQKAFSNTLSADYQQYGTALLTLYRSAVKNVNNAIQTYSREIEQGQPQQPALQRLQRDAQAAWSALQAPLLDYSQRLQASGIQSGIDFGANNLEAGGQDRIFSNAALIAAGIIITELPAFRESINRFAPYYAAFIVQRIRNGDNPRSVISDLQNTSRVPLPSPLSTLFQITQTTQVQAARLATMQTYRDNGIQYWIWSSALDLRTCVACWSEHGSRHPITEALDDHIRGRCAPVPETDSFSSLLGEGADTPHGLSAEQYFNSLPEDQQRQIMGRGRYEAYKAGLFDFHEMSKQVPNDVYGTMRVPKTLAELGIR